MDTLRALLVDAFTEEPFAGNPAGVVPDADDLSTAQMQAIATELGVAETAFLLSSTAADRRIRYFTPATEVDLCGHATVAAHAHLHGEGVIEAGDHTVETGVGTLDVAVESNGRVWMTQDDPTVREADVDVDDITEATGLDPRALDVDGLPIAFATTGLPFLVVPVRLLSDLGRIDPDMSTIESISEEAGVVGVYAFTFDTLAAASTAHGRMWAPRVGVPEDPVTGTASGAVGAYLDEYDAFDVVPEVMVFEQGHFLDRPGQVFVTVAESVEVGGQAVVALDGEIAVPVAGDGEDVIEA